MPRGELERRIQLSLSIGLAEWEPVPEGVRLSVSYCGTRTNSISGAGCSPFACDADPVVSQRSGRLWGGQATPKWNDTGGSVILFCVFVLIWVLTHPVVGVIMSKMRHLGRMVLLVSCLAVVGLLGRHWMACRSLGMFSRPSGMVDAGPGAVSVQAWDGISRQVAIIWFISIAQDLRKGAIPETQPPAARDRGERRLVMT